MVSRISGSLTLSMVPHDSRMLRIAFFQLRGTPTAILSAIVRGTTGLINSPPRYAVVTGAAPSAWTPKHLWDASNKSENLHFPKDLPDPSDRTTIADRNSHPIGNLPINLLADL